MSALARYDKALSSRAAIRSRTNVLRVLNGELVVDLYGAIARVEAYSVSIDPRPLARELTATGRVTGAVAWRRTKKGAALLEVVGEVPIAHVVVEDRARYLVKVRTDDAVGAGIFADHRAGRRRVRAFARGKRVLNLFSHAGAFGVAAACGGAARVTQVDLARKCAKWAALNLALNGRDPRRHRFVVDDALAYLERAAKKRAFDLVIVDPPTSAHRKNKKRFAVEEDLEWLADRSVRALAGAGAVLLSCNATRIPVERIANALENAAKERDIKRLIPVLPDDDVAGERGMRGVWVELL